ncbi:hypothetical protein SAMN05421748_12938 [Paractinoplanes atraurantiacus]|uniref:PH domain-containing protein n=2 Tax=Paractinoplanes atraurantiacus TaxID=1036182 RepID=A0A285K3D2_9ACTN|nr:hypothetical protein SAMN05421748_12938 [Actinoplanes atraurantiacus]
MSGAERDVQVETGVREHLQAGETFRAAVWASRADGRTVVGMTRAEMSPWRFRRPAAEKRGVNGAPRSLAVGLDEHLRTVNDPRVLALTDQRLLVLSQRTGLFRRPSSSDQALRLRWECPRTKLASATEKAGRLRLDFTDGSSVTLLTPTAEVQPFLTAAANA